MDEDDMSVEEVIESAKELIIRECYDEATDLIKKAMEICPSLENVFGILIISETLLYGNLCFQDSEFDCYSVLHLHSSSTEAEIRTRIEDIVNELTHIKYFSCYLHPLSLILLSKLKLCDESLRHKFDEKRMSIISYECPFANKKSSFKEDYLNWNPPYYNVRKLHRTLPGFMDMGFVNEKIPSFSSLSEEFRKLMNHVFDKMPQSPHYEMLPQVFEGKFLEGMKLVLDVGFVNLVEEIQKVKSPVEFMEKSKSFRKDLEQLSRMGYNVDKLNERINDLQRITERDEAIRAATDKVGDSIEKLNLYLEKLHKESGKVLSKFESTTQSSLWE